MPNPASLGGDRLDDPDNGPDDGQKFEQPNHNSIYSADVIFDGADLLGDLLDPDLQGIGTPYVVRDILGVAGSGEVDVVDVLYDFI